MREKQVENTIREVFTKEIGTPIAPDQLRAILMLFYLNKPEDITELAITEFVKQTVEKGKTAAIKRRIAAVYEKQTGETLSERSANLYYEYFEALPLKREELQQKASIRELVSQYSNHVALYKEYRKHLKTIGAREGLELTLRADEVELIFQDFQRECIEKPNTPTRQFIVRYIDDVRTLYQLCRGDYLTESEREICANEYKRERARTGTPPSAFYKVYSLKNLFCIDLMTRKIKQDAFFGIGNN